MFIGNLGRLPTDIEMAELADELNLNHRLDFEANLADARAQAASLVEATTGALREAAGVAPVPADLSSAELRREMGRTDEAFVPDLGDLGVEAEVEDVDPRSRLEESFFAKYGPLIDYRRERSDATEAKSNLMTSILNLDALIKGGTWF